MNRRFHFIVNSYRPARPFSKAVLSPANAPVSMDGSSPLTRLVSNPPTSDMLPKLPS